MNDDYLTEQEQIQVLKTWFKRYAPTVLIGILMAAIISGGWRYWQHRHNEILVQASAIYDEMLTARAQNNSNGAIQQANNLLHNYSNTPYAQIAAFMLAREAIVKKNYDEAITQYDWIMTHAKSKAFRQIARLREARVLIAEKKPDAAIALLKEVTDKSFSGLIDEVRGDAFLAMNDKPSAKKSYEVAMAELPNADIVRPILQIKYDNLSTRDINKTA